MDLFNKITVPNELTPEVLSKATLYCEDVTSAKIKPEYLLMDKFCVDDQWKKDLTPHVIFHSKENESAEEVMTQCEAAEMEHVDKNGIAREDLEKKHQLDEKDENESENKKVKSDLITKVSKAKL